MIQWLHKKYKNNTDCDDIDYLLAGTNANHHSLNSSQDICHWKMSLIVIFIGFICFKCVVQPAYRNVISFLALLNHCDSQRLCYTQFLRHPSVVDVIVVVVIITFVKTLSPLKFTDRLDSNFR